MDSVDREIADAERGASPERYNRRASAEIERVVSASSVSTASSSGSSRRSPSAAPKAARKSGSVHRSSSSRGGDNNGGAQTLPLPGADVTAGISRVSTQADLERHPTELSRIHTARSQHSATVGRSLRSRISRRASRPLPEFGAGKPFPPPLPNREDYVVEFDGPDDPMHAQNWPIRKKMYTAAVLGYTTMTSAFASSIFSAATRQIATEFDVSTTVGILGVSLYVLGFAFGPTLWAPLSELRGRRMPLVVSMFGFSIFSIGVATGKDLQTVLICRFFAGFFGACPLAVVAAVFSDMFGNRSRGIALTIFSMAVFAGPLLAPFIGGFIVESHLGWRWTMYLVAIMGFFAFFLDLLFLEETYPPVILVAKASELRRRTLNWGIHAKQEEIEVDLRELITKNFSRPMRLLFLEPIVTLLSIYMAFVYGILYLFLTAYPFVFQGVYHMSAGVSGLTFFGMIGGQLIAGITVLLQQPWYNRKLAANGGVPVPEWRLPSVMAGGVAFAAGIFWFGWSGYNPAVHWIVPTLSGLLTGFGLMSIFLQSLNYLVDAYLMFAASAIAGNTFLRSLCGAGFPLFSTYMFNGLGIQWASTLLGCVAVLLAPIPVIFYVYGHKIRAHSSFAPTPPPQAAVSENEEEAGAQTTGAEVVNDKEAHTQSQDSGASSGLSRERKDLDKAQEAV